MLIGLIEENRVVCLNVQLAIGEASSVRVVSEYLQALLRLWACYRLVSLLSHACLQHHRAARWDAQLPRR